MPLEGAYAALAGRIAGDLRRDEPMARHTSFRIGGAAALFLVCDSVPDLSVATSVLAEHEVEWTVVGKGTNLLVSDEGYEGAVMVLGREFRNRSVEGDRMEAGAGCVLAALVQHAYSKGIGGFEFAVGIPGTLGGALVMNAGTREDWIGSRTESVTVFVPGTGLERLRGTDIAWGYRRTDLRDKGIVVEAQLRAVPGDVTDIRRLMESGFRRRKQSQPLGKPNAGSVFANPPGESSGRLIEEAGLKGVRIGGARVSEVHANFIVNEGSATARDVLELMHLVRDTVRETSGIELQPEIRFLGSFS